ncbi:MAG: hypothetical protein AAFX94_17425, partial [Myxococcota bacterium]
MIPVRGGLVAACVLGVLGVSGSASAKDVRAGLLADVRDDGQLSSLAAELSEVVNQTLGTRHSVTIALEDRVSSAAADPAASYGRLSDSCDLIIAVGPRSLAAVPEAPEKPTFGIGVVSPEPQGLPLRPDGTTGQRTFTYVLTARDVGDELSQARALSPFHHVALLVRSGTAGAVAGSAERVQALEKRVGAKVSAVELTDGAFELPDGVDAAYLATGWPLPAEQLSAVAETLATARIPSYTARPTDVRAGIMASFARDNAQAQVVRKLSVMIDDHLS